MQKHRPTGVTIIAALEILLGLVSLSGGLLVLLAAGFAGFVGLTFIAALALVASAVLLILGLVALGVGVGMWMGRGWAWTLGIVFSIIGALTALFTLLLGSSGSVVGLLINLLILYYLTRPEVKGFFGKGPRPPLATAALPSK